MKKIVVSVPLAVPLYIPGVVGLPQVFTASSLRVSIDLHRNLSLDKSIVRPVLQEATAILSRKYAEASGERLDITILNPYPKSIISHISVLSACVGGLLFWYKHIWNPQIVQEFVFQECKKIYSVELGLIPASVSGGVVWFRQELPFLTSTWQISLPKTLLSKSFALTMFPQIRSIQSKIILEWKDSFEHRCRNMVQALKNENQEKFIESWRLAIKLLKQRGYKSKLFSLIHAFESLGGAVVMWPHMGVTVWYHQEVKTTSQFLKGNRILFSLIQLGAEGMRLDKTYEDNR